VVSASGEKGTKWETRVTQHLQANGVPHAERRAKNGERDRGDIAGLPGIVIEAKNTARTELAVWIDEAERERVNDGAELGVVWHHRRGKASPGAGFVTMTGDTFLALLRAAGYIETKGAS
jgi:hypothetical protein